MAKYRKSKSSKTVRISFRAFRTAREFMRNATGKEPPSDRRAVEFAISQVSEGGLDQLSGIMAKIIEENTKRAVLAAILNLAGDVFEASLDDDGAVHLIRKETGQRGAVEWDSGSIIIRGEHRLAEREAFDA